MKDCPEMFCNDIYIFFAVDVLFKERSKESPDFTLILFKLRNRKLYCGIGGWEGRFFRFRVDISGIML